MTGEDRGFRDALGRFATGVAIAACRVDGVLYGTTITSFNAVSLVPPLVLFSLARSAMTFDAWRRATTFGITILDEGQTEMSNRFARGGAEKWVGLDPHLSEDGTPTIRGGLATFECSIFERYDGGDHEIIVGNVTFFAHRRNADPLLFFAGRYRGLTPEQIVQTAPDTDAWLHGW